MLILQTLPASAADITAPSIPTTLTATAVSSSQINLSWTASNDNTAVTDYKIYRNGVLLSTMNSQLLTYQDTGLQPSTTYSYTVSAFDAAGNESAHTVPVTAVTQYPPSACDTILGNTAICPKPTPAPALPAAGGSYIDPTFGTKIIRVTDENDGISGKALYSYYSPFNKDGSLFVVQIAESISPGTPRLYLYNFDKTTDTIAKIRRLPTSPVILQTGIHWSSQYPNILFGLSGIKLYQYDTTVNTYTPLKDFTSICPSTSCSTWQLSKSYEDHYFAFTLKDATQNYKDVKVVVWDKILDQTYVLDIDTYFTFYDETRLDQSGRWAFVRGISKAGAPSQRSLFWEFTTGNIQTAPSYIGHYGTDFGGVVGAEGTVDPDNKPGKRRTDLNDFNLSKDVFYFSKKGIRSNWQISDHISILPALNNNPPYAFVGSYSGIKLTDFILDSGFIYKKTNANTSATTVSFPPEAMSQNGRELIKVDTMPTGPGQWYLDTGANAYYVWPYNNADLSLSAKNVITVMDWFPATDEIFQIWTDGSLKFRRLAHHRSGVWNYESSPRGAISPDGQYFVYTSNFDGMTNTDGTPRTDAFILVVPPLPDDGLDKISPTVPGGLTATAISSSQINLSWTASTDNVGVAGYKIYRCTGSACTPTVQIATSAANSYANTGLTASTAYTYAVSAYDAAGNNSNQSASASATTQALPDTTPPAGTVSINAGAAYLNSTSATLTLSATDSGSGMGAGAQMQFSNDNTAWSTAEAYSTSKAWALSAGDGLKTVYAKYKDTAGNWMTTAVSDTIILDAALPILSISAPTTGSTVSGASVTISAAATDTNGIAGVQFKLDGTTLGAEDTTSPYSITWDTTIAANSAHTLTAIARDNAGNSATSASVSVTVNNDTTPPVRPKGFGIKTGR